LIKRERRTKNSIRTLREALRALIDPLQPVTVRQTFYLAVSASLIDKTENAYKNTIVWVLGDMRRAGALPYGWIADNTRWIRKAPSYDSLEEALRATAQCYRRRLWAHQPVYVEVWLEKDALA